MFANVQIALLPPDFPSEGQEQRLIDLLRSVPGFQAVCLQTQIGTRKGMFLSVWDSVQAVESMEERLQEIGPPPFTVEAKDAYQVIDAFTGPDGGSNPAMAWVGYFDGLTEAEMTAHDRAGRDRIRPATAGLPGLVAAYSLRTLANDSALELVLCTSADAIEAGNRTVEATELLPGEDPSLLHGPDRVEIYRVGAYVRTGVAVRA